MAYRDDIAALGAQHLYIFDGNSNDDIGTSNGTNSGVIFTDAAIAEDATNCMTTNGRADRVTLPDDANLSGTQTRKAMAGWFETTAIQAPPCRILGDGGLTQAFSFVLGYGNNVMFEVYGPTFVNQIFGDRTLKPNRTYHLCAIFEGNGFANEVRFYIDGVEQLAAEPADRQPDVATIDDRNPTEFGDPITDVAVGGDQVILVAPVNGRYQHWASFDSAAAELTDTEVREELFEKGALPDDTIASGTESAMQTSLGALASTVRSDAPLCIRVETVTGDGDLTLTADNITFDPLASIHVQYMGTGTLTWRNTNGANASIGSTPNGGTIIFANEVTVQITVLDASDLSPISGARVFLEADTGGPLASGTDILNATTNASGQVSLTFDYTADQPLIGRARKGSSSPFYKTGAIASTITSNGLDQTVLLVRDG